MNNLQVFAIGAIVSPIAIALVHYWIGGLIAWVQGYNRLKDDYFRLRQDYRALSIEHEAAMREIYGQ